MIETCQWRYYVLPRFQVSTLSFCPTECSERAVLRPVSLLTKCSATEVSYSNFHSLGSLSFGHHRDMANYQVKSPADGVTLSETGLLLYPEPEWQTFSANKCN